MNTTETTITPATPIISAGRWHRLPDEQRYRYQVVSVETITSEDPNGNPHVTVELLLADPVSHATKAFVDDGNRVVVRGRGISMEDVMLVDLKAGDMFDLIRTGDLR